MEQDERAKGDREGNIGELRLGVCIYLIQPLGGQQKQNRRCALDWRVHKCNKCFCLFRLVLASHWRQIELPPC